MNLTSVSAYLSGSDVAGDITSTGSEVAAFLAADAVTREPTAALPIPSALAAAAEAATDLRALLWVLACAVNETTIELGARCYMGDVAGTPALLVRRLS